MSERPLVEQIAVTYAAEIEKLREEVAKLQADNERLREWCRKLIEAGDFSKSAEPDPTPDWYHIVKWEPK